MSIVKPRHGCVQSVFLFYGRLIPHLSHSFLFFFLSCTPAPSPMNPSRHSWPIKKKCHALAISRTLGKKWTSTVAAKHREWGWWEEGEERARRRGILCTKASLPRWHRFPSTERPNEHTSEASPVHAHLHLLLLRFPLLPVGFVGTPSSPSSRTDL